jgi:hypothetical protein
MFAAVLTQFENTLRTICRKRNCTPYPASRQYTSTRKTLFSSTRQGDLEVPFDHAQYSQPLCAQRCYIVERLLQQSPCRVVIYNKRVVREG